jgi:S-adenosylmethionine hydrolase
MHRKLRNLTLCLCLSITASVFAEEALVLQTDFGLKDGAVSAMKGVAFGVDKQLKIYDLTHEIPAYNIWEASYRLYQTAEYWPQGTVFVSVVDPGVGTDRKSVVLKTKTGQYFVSPDNGTLTLVAQKFGIESVRQIDEKVNRLKGSEKSYTFHGRDVYAYTGARLAAGVIDYSQVGPLLESKVVMIPYQAPELKNGELSGNIPILDIQYGNVWSNIDSGLFTQLNVKAGDTLCIKIKHGQTLKYSSKAPYVASFGDVPDGKPLVYLNSLLNVSIALNTANFSAKYDVHSGPDWSISLKKCK